MFLRETIPSSELIVLENDALRIEILPAYGAKIVSLCSKSPEMEWLWTNSSLPLEAVDLTGPFDDNFYGGIDDLFPNDFPTYVCGRYLPDHGEFWRRRWGLDEVTSTSVTLSTALDCVPVRAVKCVRLKGASMVVETQIENLSDADVPFLWVGHPAFRIDDRCEIYIPPGSAVVQDEHNGRVPKGTQPFKWPGKDLGLNLNDIPSSTCALESYYVRDVPEGRFQITHNHGQATLEVSFPTEQFPHVWLFLPLGGWRGHTVALLEAASGYPTDLAEAIEMGTHSLLPARGCIKAEMTYTIIVKETAEGSAF